MTQSQNQFAMNAEKGQVDLDGNMTNVLSCQISHSEVATLVNGQAVKIEDSAGGVPKVLALDLVTDVADGFIVRTLRTSEYVAGDRVSIAIDGTVMQMEAGAAIARRGEVEVVLAGDKVITAAGINPKSGIALDKAAADGDLIKVYIRTLQLT